jgi:hypothetical protein
MQPASAPKPRCVRGPATLGEFVLTNRPAACPRDEWIAVLADSTEVVVPGLQGAPSPLAVERAVSIVQSRAYLEKRALQRPELADCRHSRPAASGQAYRRSCVTDVLVKE